MSVHILKSWVCTCFPVTELNNKLEIAVVGNIMSCVPFSTERKSPVASLKFVPEIDRDLSSPAWCDRNPMNPVISAVLLRVPLFTHDEKRSSGKRTWVPCRIGASKWLLKMYVDKHHLYGIALQQIIGFMLCAMETMGELGEKQSFYFLGSLFRITELK